MEEPISRLAQLYGGYVKKTLTEGEMEELMQLIRQKEHEEEIRSLIDMTVRDASTDREIRPQRADQLFQNIVSAGTPVVPIRKKSYLPWAAAAAGIIIFIGLGVWLSPRKEGPVIAGKASETVIKTIMPAGNRATLTLGDGSTIVLDSVVNGTVASQGNTRVVKMDNGRLAYQVGEKGTGPLSFNVIHTPRGGKYEVTLPDGTKVWMNAASSLKFPTDFTGQSREVTLTGEAYFEVAENKRMPFIVSVGEATVKVLGTHFNINGYSDEGAIHTTLLEGAVQVSSNGGGKLLHPGQQAILDHATSAMTVQAADVNQVMAWKNGRFEFDNIDLPAIMRQISRWYDVDVEYRSGARNIQLGGGISRKANLEDLLPLLEANGIHCKLEGRKIIIY
jgi:ferric-dicitrate binding protein FerR (iron transport regulator)